MKKRVLKLFKNVLSVGSFILIVSCMGNVHQQVIDQSIKEYEITVKSGSKMDMYVRAGNVAEAYLQAGDADNYAKWKEVEKEYEKELGMYTGE